MSKSNKGTKMDNQDKNDPQIDVSKGAKAAANEFAPTQINDGGEDGARFVEPAKLPEPPEGSSEAAPQDDEAERVLHESAQKREHAAERERVFVDYVNGELKQEADELGYDLKLAKRASTAGVGPVMLYDPSTRDGRVFASRAEAPSHFLTGDQLNEIRAEEAERARRDEE